MESLVPGLCGPLAWSIFGRVWYMHFYVQRAAFVGYWYAGSISTPVHVTAFIVQILVVYSGLGVQGYGEL